MFQRLFILAMTLLFPMQSYAAPVTYLLEKEKSKVGFTWFLGAEPIKGSMPVADADISLDLTKLENSQVTVSVDVARARAGFPFANQGIKGETVLWAKKFPKITFKGKKFIQNGGNTALVEGDLTVRGVTKPATFKAELFRKQGSAPGDHRELSVRLTSSLSRSAFGANGWANLAGDEVRLDILAYMKVAQ